MWRSQTLYSSPIISMQTTVSERHARGLTDDWDMSPFDSLPHYVKLRLDDVSPTYKDWKVCDRCGVHNDVIKLLACKNCYDSPFGRTYY